MKDLSFPNVELLEKPIPNTNPFLWMLAYLENAYKMSEIDHCSNFESVRSRVVTQCTTWQHGGSIVCACVRVRTFSTMIQHTPLSPPLRPVTIPHEYQGLSFSHSAKGSQDADVKGLWTIRCRWPYRLRCNRRSSGILLESGGEDDDGSVRFVYHRSEIVIGQQQWSFALLTMGNQSSVSHVPRDRNILARRRSR
jgi:hypothetical protein